MSSPLYEKLNGVRDLKRILEITVREIGETFNADSCQAMLSNPLDPNMTSLCQFNANPEQPTEPAVATIPLVLQGRTFGSVSISRENDLTSDEMSAMRVLLGEVGDIIRLAQINEIVTRDTFRETFLVEIGNVMSYSLGIGDALFMVVNILGKCLEASRCLFICTDDTQAGWKCYEFWKQDKGIKSCQEYYWPSPSSPLVAQVLLSKMPMKVFEGRENSYVSPVQEELQFIGVKSLLGVPLKSDKATHGCVILQQCDYRRAWTRNELDMVQSVADKVAEALLKLPAEKLAKPPIMQLHQRIVAVPNQQDGRSDVEIRRALKGALGQQAIPSARKTSQPPVPPAAKPEPAAAPTPPQPAAAQAAAGQTPAKAEPATPAKAESFTPEPAKAESVESTTSPRAFSRLNDGVKTPDAQGDIPAPIIKNVTRPGRTGSQEMPKPAVQSFEPSDGGSLQDKLKTIDIPSPEHDPYADLDFGDFGEEETPHAVAPAEPAKAEPAKAELAKAAEPEPAKPAEKETPASKPAAEPAPKADAAPATEPVNGSGKADAGKWGDLDSIPAPKAKEPAAPGAWGNLDSIPTPGGGSGGGGGGLGGLKGSMLGKAKAASVAGKLGSSFKSSRGQEAPGAAPAATAAPSEPVDEETARKKLDQLLSNAANETSDYIFATTGLDARLLGRIDGWVAQIEQKDKYSNGHALPVARYAVAIAEELGMKPEDILTVRLAALVHDLGKLGIPQQILQKPDESLEDEQFVMKMQHAVAGAQLLESFPDLKHLAPIVMAHHEEYDGEGFPQGLKGDEIPVAGRILGVANSYHEMVADKRFSKGMAPVEAQKILVEGAGSQYDPTLVEALLQAIKTKKVPEAC